MADDEKITAKVKTMMTRVIHFGLVIFLCIIFSPSLN
jgi:hypothetical protein